MHAGLKLAASSIALMVASPAFALPPGFAQQADAILADAYAADGPGAAVVVTEKGRIVYHKGVGLADVEARRAVTPDTVFRLGSITKQFSAAVVLQLAAEGKLELRDPISKYLPDYPGGANITVAQLLNHTSGIQSYTGIPGWMVEANTAKAYTTEQLVAVFKDLPPPSKPGEKYDYNNSGYVLVGALIEAVTKRPWYEEVQRRITKPLGLKSIRYGVDEASIAAMAKPYSEDEDKVVAARAIHMSVPAAAGALVGSVDDLAKWGNALHHGKVLSPTWYMQMTSPTRLADGHIEQYGYGIAPEKFMGLDSIGHSGGIFGGSTDSIYIPSQDLFVAVFTNSDRPKTAPAVVKGKLAALAIGKTVPTFKTVALDPKAVEPFLGVYKFPDAERSLAIMEGQLYAIREGRPPMPVYANGDGRYHYGSRTLSWFALRHDAGKPVMEFHGDGGPDLQMGTWKGPMAQAAETVAVPRGTLASYAGTYTTPMGKAVVAMGEGDTLTIQLAGQKAIAMRAVGERDFAIDMVGAKVQFAATDGKVSGLTIEQGGRKLPATRD